MAACLDGNVKQCCDLKGKPSRTGEMHAVDAVLCIRNSCNRIPSEL